MAVAYESVAIKAYAAPSGGNVTIDKPTGLAEGDLMLSYCSGPNASDFTPPSGWTALFQQNSLRRIAIAWKVATAGDVAASNFSWGVGGAEKTGACIIRISGGATPLVGSLSTTSATTSHTFTGGVTPSANSLLFICTGAANTTSFSAQAIVTSNPSWAEAVDQQVTTSDSTMAVAYALRPEATATGNFTASSADTIDAFGVFVHVPPIVSVSVSPAVMDIVSSIQGPTVSAGATVSPDVVSITSSIQEPTVSTPTETWTNQSKNSSSWTNQNKS